MKKTYLLNRGFISLALLVLITLHACKKKRLLTSESSMTIAFGSCNHHWDEDQPIWKEVLKNSPDLWIWLGDMIYSDTEDMKKMRTDYNIQKLNSDYRNLTNSCPVIGIWDDHDYGVNNGGKEFSKKDSSKLLLFEFLKVPKDHPAWTRNGAYQSYIYQKDALSVKVLLLDVRYFRDSLGAQNGTILGQEQWHWLEKELKNSTADVHVIGGGIQFLAEDHRFEKWANFPSERTKFLRLLDTLSVSNPILISGDRHIGEMALVPLPLSQNPLLEVTSSGLTHAYTNFTSEKNRHRIGSVLPQKNFGTLTISKNDGEVSFHVALRNERNQIKNKVAKHELSVKMKEIE